jgi:hypothetical protein
MVAGAAGGGGGGSGVRSAAAAIPGATAKTIATAKRQLANIMRGPYSARTARTCITIE